ncbi:hypothetical protein [Nitrobacter sp.]|uniref:hypothetical protein n=1 Tax=unclassified Nitrobacter TaxID=2620411 RepID=UPI002CF55067|nr:hypothetical protein [Nitrobacter sp.]
MTALDDQKEMQNRISHPSEGGSPEAERANDGIHGGEIIIPVVRCQERSRPDAGRLRSKVEFAAITRLRIQQSGLDSRP